jgi:hypothetical protein
MTAVFFGGRRQWKKFRFRNYPPLALTDQAISHGLAHISSCNVAIEMVVGARSAGYLLLHRLCPQSH